MSSPTFVNMLVTHLFRIDVSYVDFYGDSLAHRPLFTNRATRSHRDIENQVLAVQAKIPKLVDIVANGGDFQLHDPKQSVKIYDICIGVLDSWVETLRKGTYRGPVDLELLSGLDELAEYVYPNTLFYRPATPDRVKMMASQLGAFGGMLDRDVTGGATEAPVAREEYVSRLSSITSLGIRNGLIKA